MPTRNCHAVSKANCHKAFPATLLPFILAPSACGSTANWQEVLQQYIAPEDLPAIYGGKLTDPDGDPRCRTLVSYPSSLGVHSVEPICCCSSAVPTST